jgi:hypothetical protein
MRKFYLGLLFCCIGAGAYSQTYTWAENAACIFYTHCTGCHFPGGPGPFSLIDYGNAFAHRFEISDAVNDHYMPPWPPDADYQTYAHERLMTQTEIDVITAWANQGGIMGNLAAAPTPPTYSAGGSQLSQIDFSANIGTYTNTAYVDDYRCFVIPTSFGVDKYISAIEVLPGNRQMVHHVLVYQDVANTCALLDAADPGLGYTSFGGTGSNTSKLMNGFVPGSQPAQFPAGMGMKLDANAYIILQIHYAPGTNGLTDSTRVNLTFAGGPVRSLSLSPILSHNTNITPPLVIPANTIMSFTETYTVPSITAGADSITVLSVIPHMHNVATSIKCYAIQPGNDTVPIINIPDWDFHWQGMYDFRQPKVFPEGTVLKAEAVYNNTTSNIHAPDPSNPVTAGESTNDEMMLVFFSYLLHQPGDQDIIVDTVTVKPMYNGCQFVGLEANENVLAQVKIYPNPAFDLVNLSFEQYTQGDVVLSLLDISGKLVSQYTQPQVGVGTFTKQLDVQALTAGIYTIWLWNGNDLYTRPLVISR